MRVGNSHSSEATRRIGALIVGALLLVGCSDGPATTVTVPPATDSTPAAEESPVEGEHPVERFLTDLEALGDGNQVSRPVREAATAHFQEDFEELISECVVQPDLAHTVLKPTFPDGLSCEDVWARSSTRHGIDHSTATFVLNTTSSPDNAPGEVQVVSNGLVGKWHWDYRTPEGEKLTGAPVLRLALEERDDSPVGWVITDLG